MKMVHGTFKSFKEMGAAMGVKAPKEQPEAVHKCKNCGGPLTHIPGTNAWICEFNKLEDVEMPNGTSVQVFSKCNNFILTE